MVLYIVEEAFRNSFYGSTGWLWGFPPLVFLFVMRVWLLRARPDERRSGRVRRQGSDQPRAGGLVAALLRLCVAWMI